MFRHHKFLSQNNECSEYLEEPQTDIRGRRNLWHAVNHTVLKIGLLAQEGST